MKYKGIVALLAIVVFAVGCMQKPVSTNQNVNTPAVNQPTGENKEVNTNVNVVKISNNANIAVPANLNTNESTQDAAWKTYSDAALSLQYPAYLTPKKTTAGVRTTITFSGTKQDMQVNSTLSLASMPNQGGSRLTDYTNEVTSQSGYVKSAEVTVAGVTAYKLTLPESGAGSRYLLIKGQTIYDISLNGFSAEDASTILASLAIK